MIRAGIGEQQQLVGSLVQDHPGDLVALLGGIEDIRRERRKGRDGAGGVVQADVNVQANINADMQVNGAAVATVVVAVAVLI